MLRSSTGRFRSVSECWRAPLGTSCNQKCAAADHQEGRGVPLLGQFRSMALETGLKFVGPHCRLGGVHATSRPTVPPVVLTLHRTVVREHNLSLQPGGEVSLSWPEIRFSGIYRFCSRRWQQLERARPARANVKNSADLI